MIVKCKCLVIIILDNQNKTLKTKLKFEAKMKDYQLCLSKYDNVRTIGMYFYKNGN